MTTAAPQDPSQPPPWWASFPEVQSSCSSLDASEVADLLEVVGVLGSDPVVPLTAERPSGDIRRAAVSTLGRDFLLVDVRRTDWEGGTISTSINLPAQSFFQTRSIVYMLCKNAHVKTIIFYCGSSAGRGTRCAGWMQDYLNELGDTSMKAVILKGGIKGWQKTYGGKMMDWYDDKAWESQSK